MANPSVQIRVLDEDYVDDDDDEEEEVIIRQVIIKYSGHCV